MFSSFNEAFNPSYLIDGMGTTHFALGPHTGLKELREKYATPIPRPTDDEWCNWLVNMDYKIGKLWGSVCKIIVEYDNTTSGCTTKVRLDHYDAITRNVLKWPVARVVQSEPYEKRWMHYNPKARHILYNEIYRIEQM
jgi:hypothetical protein